jgi:acetyl esterase/lipase
VLSKLSKDFSYESVTIPINVIDGQQLYGTFYRPSENKDYKGTILYFHGGGMMFGYREDLPQPYISLLTANGYGLLALDYLLAPESKLPAIMQGINHTVEWFIQEGTHALNIDHSDYYLMGRSAGGYLALYSAVHASIKPRGVISFYGYYTLSDASFNVPSRYYLHYPEVSNQMMDSLIVNQPITSEPSKERYLLYLAARQRGNWIPFISSNQQQIKDYNLTNEQLANLPATFISAATQDPDVPVRQSKMLHKFIPESELHLVDSAEHDFDRTQVNELGMGIYLKLVDWLNRN